MPREKPQSGPRKARRLDTELAHFVVIVLPVEDVPLLRAFENDLALRGDLLPCRSVDHRFLSEQRLQRLARLLADRVAVFIETDLVDLGERIGHGVSQLVQLVAADPHSTALYLRASSVFTFLN